MATIDSVKLPDNSTYDLTDNYSGYQKQTLTAPITINGVQETTVEGALGGLNDYGDALADNLAANEESGAKNLAILDLGAIMPINTGGTWSGNVYTHRTVNFTVTDNGVSVSGTASGGAAFIDIPLSTLTNGKEYIANGISGGADETYQIKFLNSSLVVQSVSDLYDGERTFEKNSTNQNVELYRIRVANGANVTTDIYPMIRDARIVDDTFAPYAETNLQLTRKTSGLSNENLFDNPWFTVNQRGVTSATIANNAYYLDRWFATYATNAGTIEAVSGGIKLTPASGDYVYIKQRSGIFTSLYGKVITASVLFGDGTIKSGTITRASGTTQDFIDESNIRIRIVSNNDFEVRVGTTTTIRALKLELGSISTLANDVEPNYTTELLKCQRYFQRISALAGYAILATGVMDDATTLWGQIPLTVPLRATPTVSTAGTFNIRHGGVLNSVSSITLELRSPTMLSFFVASSTNLTAGTPAQLLFNSTSTYIDLSADL